MSSYQVILLTAAVGVLGANSLVVSPIAAAVASGFPGTEPADIMVASAGLGLGTAGAALMLAPLADRFGADRSLIAAMILLTLASAIAALAPVLTVLVVAHTVSGVAAGIALPAIYSLAAEIAPKGQEGRTMGTVLTGWTISMVFGVTLSTLLADILHWRSVFITIGVLAGLITIILLPTRFPRRVADIITSPLTGLRVPGIFRALFVQVCLMLAFYGTYSFLGTHLDENLGLSTASAAAPVLAYGIGFGTAAIFDGMIDRRGYKGLAHIVFSFTATALILIAVTADILTGLTVAFLFWGLVNHFALNLTVSRLVALDPKQRGAIMGLNSTVTYLCVFAGAIGFRPVYEWGGLTACAMIGAALAALIVAEAFSLRSVRNAA
ncbi:MFS transporter [Pseudaestuariivita rosea]|uniref:MFS transporter n=1 Tax=Pseudaestuariivita rosea TaxID=2763263 RepID=UPI001ABBB3B4|nr:MFS transporter [Pseudaestuariivita rosea]